MGTFEASTAFRRAFASLTEADRERFKTAAKQFSDDLNRNGFSKGLRLKKLQGRNDEWEITFAPDGRAVFRYGESVRPGVRHVEWLAIGTHDDLF